MQTKENEEDAAAERYGVFVDARRHVSTTDDGDPGARGVTERPTESDS